MPSRWDWKFPPVAPEGWRGHPIYSQPSECLLKSLKTSLPVCFLEGGEIHYTSSLPVFQGKLKVVAFWEVGRHRDVILGGRDGRF